MAARIDFGAELRRRRQAAGMSLAQFSSLVHYSKGQLSKIESGQKTANPTFARQCDAALDADGELIALVTEPATAADHDEHAEANGSRNGFWRLSLDPDGSTYFAPGPVLEPDLGPMAFGTVFPNGQQVSDPAAMLSLFRARFEQARALAQLMSAKVFLPMLVTETHTLRLLARSETGESAAELWRLAAQYAEYVGWMTQESGDDQLAWWWTRFAVRMATRGGNESMRAFAYVRGADITLHADDPHQTLDLAWQAQQDSSATARVRGLAAQREAQGYALLGNREASLRAMDRSAVLLDEAAGSPGPVLGTWRTPDTTMMVRGWCLYDLGRPAEAAALLEPGIAQFPDGASRARARYALRTALAQAGADEVDRACDIIEWLAADVRQVDSATVRHDVKLLHRELRRRSGNRRVRDLLPVLADLMASPRIDRNGIEG